MKLQRNLNAIAPFKCHFFKYTLFYNNVKFPYVYFIHRIERQKMK